MTTTSRSDAVGARRLHATPTVLSDGITTLRTLAVADEQVMHEAVVESTAEVSPWLPWCHAGYTRAETAAFIGSTRRAWADGTQFQFGILDAAVERFLGVIGINHIAKTNQLANIGYWVRSTSTKQGVASRAVRLVAQFAFRELGLSRLEIACIPSNLPSRRVAEKVGARLEAISRNRLVMHKQPYDAALYALTPEDLAANQRLVQP